MQTDNAAENVQAAEEQELQPAEETKKGKEKKPVNVKKEILSWILTLGAAVIIALVIRTFLFEPVRVDGHSMDDTLANGEIMFVTKPEYLTGDPQPGDVVIETVAAEYLAPLKAEGVDTLVLGCTHYPLLKEVIRNFMGADVTLIDSGAAVAQQLCGYLQEQDLAAEESQVGTCRWYVSDSTENFGSLASRFLGRPVTEPVEQVSLEGE